MIYRLFIIILFSNHKDTIFLVIAFSFSDIVFNKVIPNSCINMVFCSKWWMNTMIATKVEISPETKGNLADLMVYLRSMQSDAGLHHYIDDMLAEVQSHFIFADFCTPADLQTSAASIPAPALYFPLFLQSSTNLHRSSVLCCIIE